MMVHVRVSVAAVSMLVVVSMPTIEGDIMVGKPPGAQRCRGDGHCHQDHQEIGRSIEDEPRIARCSRRATARPAFRVAPVTTSGAGLPRAEGRHLIDCVVCTGQTIQER
jgi:hypothetical protein